MKTHRRRLKHQATQNTWNILLNLASPLPYHRRTLASRPTRIPVLSCYPLFPMQALERLLLSGGLLALGISQRRRLGAPQQKRQSRGNTCLHGGASP